MIYYLMFMLGGILIDYKDLKNSDKKSDVIFYIFAMVIVLAIGVFYFINTDRMGIAEYILKLIN